MSERKKIDLADLRWGLLDWVARVKPMDVHKMRETLRRSIIDLAEKVQDRRVAGWAASLSPAAMDYRAHLGFCENMLLRSMTGNLEDPRAIG
jgi:hypothetical protein